MKQNKAITLETFWKMSVDLLILVIMNNLLHGWQCCTDFMLLRKSNLVPDSQPTFDPIKKLTRSAVCISAKTLLVEVRWAKNLLA